MVNELLSFTGLAALVDFAGTVLIGYRATRTLVRYVASGGSSGVIAGLQYRLAADLITALSFKSGAGILRTLTVSDWPHFGLLLAIISLRFFLGQTFRRLYKS